MRSLHPRADPGYKTVIRTSSTKGNSLWQSLGNSTVGYLLVFTLNTSTVSSNFHEHVHNKFNPVNDQQEYGDDGHKINDEQGGWDPSAVADLDPCSLSGLFLSFFVLGSTTSSASD
jgi:hypothetical protein